MNKERTYLILLMAAQAISALLKVPMTIGFIWPIVPGSPNTFPWMVFGAVLLLSQPMLLALGLWATWHLPSPHEMIMRYGPWFLSAVSISLLARATGAELWFSYGTLLDVGVMAVALGFLIRRKLVSRVSGRPPLS